MIGLAFNLVEKELLARRGDLGLTQALDAGGFVDSDPWLDAMNYPDADFQRWLVAVAATEGCSVDELLRHLGGWVVPGLLARYALLVRQPRNAREFIDDLGCVLIPQLRRLLRDLRDGSVRVQAGATADQGELIYSASGQYCAAIEGALLGLAHHFGLDLRTAHSHCCSRGDAECRYTLQFSAAAGARGVAAPATTGAARAWA